MAVAKTTARMEVPGEQCLAAQAICYKKRWGPGCWQCSQRKVKRSIAAPLETGKGEGQKGEGSEGPPPSAMVAVNEEMVGFLRRLVEALERGVDVLEAMEDHYMRIGDERRDESEETKE